MKKQAENKKEKSTVNEKLANQTQTKIIVERSFGELDLVELYTDYIAEKMRKHQSVMEHSIV